MTTALKNAALQLAREEKRAAREKLELAMLLQLKAEKLDTGMVREHRFDPVRGWRFDFAWPQRKWALEVEGGTWVGGGHNRGKGYMEDCEKYAAATLAGWRVLRATTDHVKAGTALAWVIAALRPRPVVLAALDKVEPGELAHEKDKPVRSPKYLREVATLPCANCGREGASQAAHINRGKGMAMKAGDNKTFPLCTFTLGAGKTSCHYQYDNYQLGDKHQSAEMGERWAIQTFNTLKRSGQVPMNVPAPRFHSP